MPDKRAAGTSIVGRGPAIARRPMRGKGSALGAKNAVLAPPREVERL